MRKYNKKGVSLIVLVITIIVMIILAAAIILSISNSGIMDKANKAKQESDAANLKEYVNLLMAEWELMDTNERNGKSSVEYVNEKLSKKYPNKTYSADGEFYSDLSNIAKNAILKGLKIGDEVKYTIAEADIKEHTPDSSKTGTTNSKLTTQTNLKWIYIGVSEDGELLISPDVSNGLPSNLEVTLTGKQGYLTGPEELNTICYKLYSTDNGTARNMNIDDVTRILGYTGDKGGYLDTNYEFKSIPEAEKISILESKFGELINKKTPTKPDGKNSDIGEYYSDYYGFSKTSVKMNHSEYVDLIFPQTESNFYYWLASTCTLPNFHNGSQGSIPQQQVDFDVRFVWGGTNDGAVATMVCFTSDNGDVR